jgi:signal transduction histidine kinase
MKHRAVTTSLRDDEFALRDALDFVPQGVAVFDAALTLIAANARYSELLNLPENLVFPGAALYDIALYLAQRGDLGEGDAATLARERVTTLTQNETSVSQRLGGSGQVLEFHSARLPNGGLVVSFADVSARVEAERELERVAHSLEGRVAERTATLTRVNTELEIARAKADAANRDKTRFLAAASHDLLQPLNAARLYTATLIERAQGGGMADLARSIEASLNAVEEIMSALLDISRIDSGALKPAPAAFALSDLTRKIEVEFGPLAREKNIELRLPATSAAAIADRALVGRILQNLVSNAIKYTRPGGRVLVGCRLKGTRVRLDVIDTGIGFNRDQHALIFAEFSRLEHGARMAQGLGLGLSIVKRLVSALGLALELDSVEGKGSRFSLYIPLTRVPRPAGVDPTPLEEPATGIAKLRVLCVDNERAILDAMSGLLSGWGCDVRVARSLKDIARDQLLVGWLPDIVLMDYHLDQTSGLDAIEWLRQNVGGHLPAALVTADRSLAVRALAEERGVAVITKPVKPAALRATISGLAGLRGRQAVARPLDDIVSN